MGVQGKGTSIRISRPSHTQTPEQIASGVREAQESEGGGAINTQMHNVGTGHLIQSGSAGMFTRVDLDLAVSAETTGGGRATLKVFRFRRRKRWRAQRWL